MRSWVTLVVFLGLCSTASAGQIDVDDMKAKCRIESGLSVNIPGSTTERLSKKSLDLVAPQTIDIVYKSGSGSVSYPYAANKLSDWTSISIENIKFVSELQVYFIFTDGEPRNTWEVSKIDNEWQLRFNPSISGNIVNSYLYICDIK